MLSKVLIGRYIPGDSIIHALDPRTKLILTLMFMVIVFIANSWVTYLVLVLFALIITKVADLSIRFLFDGLKLILFLFIFTFLMHVFVTKGGTVLVDGGFFTIESQGIITGIFITTRLTLLVVITTILTLTTSPIELTHGLEKMFEPLKRFRVPVSEIAMMMSISLRFIPTLMDETEKIIKAQSARGSSFRVGSIKERLQALLAIFIPLFVSAFKRAEELAVAMDVRGYNVKGARTSYRLLEWRRKDTIAIIVMLLLAIILFVLRMYGI